MTSGGRPAIEAAVFDLDGTLIDTIGDIAASVNEAAARAGLRGWSEEEIRPRVGRGLRNLIAGLLSGTGRDEPGLVESLTKGTVAAYARAPAARSLPYPGMAETLETLAARGIRTAVLSNKADELVGSILAIVFPEHRFEQARGARSGFAHKPDPAQCLDILGAMGVSPERAVFIGDSAVDVETAKAAGMPSMACLWGFRPEGELTDSGPDCIARSPSDILAAIDALARR